MRAGVYRGAFDIRVEEVADAVVEAPTDALVRVVRASVCGSDLWFYRGIRKEWESGWRTGHEITGLVEEVGDEVDTVRPGDLVVVSFAYGCGRCELCRGGLPTSCPQGAFFGGPRGGGQAELVRVPFADTSCWVVPADTPEERYDAVHLLSDVLLTGYHAAVLAGLDRADATPATAVVVGDGAVGLSGVLSARLLGAETVVLCGRHDDRLEIGRQFGATHTTALRGEALHEHVRQLTDGGAPAVLECVGTTDALADAAAVCRDGGRIGMVGVPVGVDGVPIFDMFRRNLTLAVGIAPTSIYVEKIGPLVAAGDIDPSPLADATFALDELPAAFEAMHDRSVIKAMVAMDGR
ncbi:MAG: alcohol dehydrogenase catalytic domain-containing protein [Nitriliruptorales bacterium]|nr:alcohol dehydrogenase catalytic domain-containing protein [Nitriliruptorales bacterium]